MDEQGKRQARAGQDVPPAGSAAKPPPMASSAPKAKRRKPGPVPADLAAARERMESSILERRKAQAHCGTCGAQGNWITESVKRPLRYLLCGGCRVGRFQIAVTAEEIERALAAGAAGGK